MTQTIPAWMMSYFDVLLHVGLFIAGSALFAVVMMFVYGVTKAMYHMVRSLSDIFDDNKKDTAVHSDYTSETECAAKTVEVEHNAT